MALAKAVPCETIGGLPTTILEIVPNGVIVRPKEVEKFRKEIIRLHQSVMKSSRESHREMIGCGLILIKSKKEHLHGEFLPWLASDFSEEGFGIRTAQRYMSKARTFLAYLKSRGIRYTTDAELKKHLDSPLLEDYVRDPKRSASQKGLSAIDPNEWCSPENVIDAVKEVMGEIECDPSALPKDWAKDHGKRNILPDQNGLSRDTAWGRTNWVCPGHKADPIPWFGRALYERDIGNLDQAILCFPESALKLPSRLFEFPVAITAQPLTVTKRAKGKPKEFELPTRSLFVYVTANQPDVERFARAFCDIAVVFAPVPIQD